MLELDSPLKTVDFLDYHYLYIHSLLVPQYDRDFVEHKRNTAEKATPTWCL